MKHVHSFNEYLNEATRNLHVGVVEELTKEERAAIKAALKEADFKGSLKDEVTVTYNDAEYVVKLDKTKSGVTFEVSALDDEEGDEDEAEELEAMISDKYTSEIENASGDEEESEEDKESKEDDEESEEDEEKKKK